MAARPLFGIITGLRLIVGGSHATHAEPRRIGHLTWVGLGALSVAEEELLFATEEVEVELINMAIQEVVYAGLFAGQIVRPVNLERI